MAARPKPACPVCLGRSWQHLPTRLGLLPPATRGLVLVARTLLGSQHPLLAKERCWGFALSRRRLKRNGCLEPTGIWFQLSCFWRIELGDLSKAASVTKWDKKRVGITPHCQGHRSAVLCLADEGRAVALAPLESLQFETSKTETRLQPCVWKTSGNHKQLPRNGVRLSSLTHLLNLAFSSGICHPFLGFSFVLACSRLPSHFLYTRCSWAEQGSLLARSMVSTKYSGTGFVT